MPAIKRKLNFYECLQLLDKAAEYGIIKRTDDCTLKMYQRTTFGEGWVDMPITTCAEILADDINGQDYYREALRRKGISSVKFCDMKTLLCAMG